MVTVGDAHLNQNKNQKMSLKEVRHAGQSSGRKAAMRDEVLPSQQPLPKPTRDVSASNRSHSLTHEQPILFPSHRRLMFDCDPNQMEFEKQANVAYLQQFRMLGRLLGNQGMDFEELREKVEGLVLADRPHHDPVLLQRIHTLQKELACKNREARSSQSLPPSQEYLRGLETELDRRSKIISELGESVPREVFEKAVRGLQAEIDAKSAELKILEDQAQEARLKTAGNVSLLEEELIRQKQTIQKLTFELDSQKRHAQNASDDVDRLRRRQKELSASLQSEGKATYQGLTYSSHALLMQLEARDQQLAGALNEQKILQTEIISLKRDYWQAEELLAAKEQERVELQGKLQYLETQRARLMEEIQTVTLELRSRGQVVGEANQAHQILIGKRERIEDELRTMQEKLKTAEAKERESKSEFTKKIAQDEQIINNLKLHLEQSKRTAERANQEVRVLSYKNQQLQKKFSEWNIAVRSRQSHLDLKEQEVEHLRRLLQNTKQPLAQREEEMKQQLKEMMERLDLQARRQAQITQQLQLKIAQYDEQIHYLEASLASQQNISREGTEKYEALSLIALKLEETIHQISSESSKQYTLIQQKNKEANQLHQQIEQLIQEKQILLVRIEAFQQQKYVLMGRLEESETMVAEATAKGGSLQEAVKGKTALQAEIQSQQAEIQQLRCQIEEVRTREALMQAELEQRQQQTKQAQEEWKRQQQHYQQEMITLTRYTEELQEQLEQERQHHEGRNEEEARVREELERELQTVKNSLREAEFRIQEGHRIQEQLKIQTQRLQKELNKAYEQERQQGQRILQDDIQLRVEKEHLTTIIQQLNQHIKQEKERDVTVQQHHHSEIVLLQSQIVQLHTIIDDLKAEKEELEREIQALRKSNQNELASLTFQNFEGEHQTQNDVDLRITIQNLQKELQEAYHREREAVKRQKQTETRVEQILQREEQWRKEEEQRVQLSYSHTLQSAGLLGSLESQRQWLQNQNHRLEQELIESKNQFIEKEKELIEIANDLQSLRERLEYDQQALQEQQNNISLLHAELEKSKNESSTNRQKAMQWQEISNKKEAECTILKQKFDQRIQKIAQQQQQLFVLKGEVEMLIANKNEKQALANQLSKARIELERATQEITSLKQQIEVYQIQVMKMEKNAEAEHSRSKIEAQRHKEKESKQDEFQEQRILSRLSKRSKLSEEEGVSKGGSSDGELSRRILNDPSKISGQQSKFAHHLLAFQNSKIQIQRDIVSESPPEQIKQQRQEQSVLSKQQLQNKTPESSHRQINTTHFDRETKRDNRDSPRISDKGSIRESQRYSANSFTSVPQAQEEQEGSRPFEKSPQGEQKEKHEQKEERPKEYLPQQSSRKAISNPNGSKQSIPQQQQQRQTFSRNSQQTAPIYVARPSAFQQQERCQNNHSQSGSKTKVRISYGQPSDKSIQIKRREPELAGSRASNASVQSIQPPVRDSINQISPIETRHQAQHTTPFILSTQKRENLHSRPSIQNDLLQPSESIINKINQVSRPSTESNKTHSQKADGVRLEGLQRKESSPIYIQPLIGSAYSPRHSIPITFNHTTVLTQQDSLKPTFPLYATQPPNTPSVQLRLYQSQREGGNEQLAMPGSKIVMRSVIGGKRSSLMNDTATFGKNSQKMPLNETFTESNCSGIDVLQLDWMEPCCKNN